MGWKEAFFGGGDAPAATVDKKEGKEKPFYSNAESIADDQELLAQSYDTLGLDAQRDLVKTTAEKVPGAKDILNETARDFNAEAQEALRQLS